MKCAFSLTFKAVLALLLAQSASQAQTTVTTNWSTSVGTVRPNLISLNLWSGMDPSVAKSNAAYRSCLDTTRPNFVRYHAGEQLGTSGRGWCDSNGNWVSQRVLDSVGSTQGYSQTRMVTISGWPGKWNASGSGQLDPSHLNDYANWCAQLVTILKNGGAGVTYYEPFNESEGAYGSDMNSFGNVFLAARNAIKAADPGAQVGAPVFANPWNSNWGPFLDKVGTNIDFVSYHHYASGDPNVSVSSLYDATLGGSGLIDRASQIKADMKNRGITGPLMLTEQNMFYAYNQDTGRRLMKTSRAAVFDALMLKGAAEAGDLEAMPSWNDGDYTYGKFTDASGSFALRPAGYFLKIARENLVGQVSSTVSSSTSTVQGFAVTSGTKYSLCLINRTESPQTVNLNFGGWSPTGGTYTLHQISDNGTDGNSVGGYTSSTQTWSGAPQNLAMPANSVFVLVFNGNSLPSGPQPYGGTARSIPGRIQAEDYDTGGQNVGYYDTSYFNTGGQYRQDRVDIASTGDTGGGYKVTDTQGGEWLRYTVNASQGVYDLTVRASSYWGTNSNAITVKLAGTPLATVGVPQTWNDDGFASVTTRVYVPASLAGNNKELRLEFAQGGFAVNWVDFTAVPLVNRATGGTASASSNPVGAEAAPNAFDGSTGTKWLGNMTSSGAWIAYAFGGGSSYPVCQYQIASANDDYGRDPRAWKLQGWNGSAWVDVDSQSNQSFSGRYTFNTYTFANTTSYSGYRLLITQNSGSTETQTGGNGITQLSELRLLSP